ncbi:unnamed protein product [Somion occarium]|uniref:Uncharacterized protein n=1 Tax=Somion occarium TaxID=3059160 RepID=A0ABP1DIP0_9APHY
MDIYPTHRRSGGVGPFPYSTFFSSLVVWACYNPVLAVLAFQKHKNSWKIRWVRSLVCTSEGIPRAQGGQGSRGYIVRLAMMGLACTPITVFFLESAQLEEPGDKAPSAHDYDIDHFKFRHNILVDLLSILKLSEPRSD